MMKRKIYLLILVLGAFSYLLISGRIRFFSEQWTTETTTEDVEVITSRRESTTEGEIIASYPNGSGETDIVRKKGKDFQFEIQYERSLKIDDYSWSLPGKFNRNDRLSFAEAIAKKEEDPFFKLYINSIPSLQAQQDPKSPRYPIAGVTAYEGIKNLKIDGKSPDEITEYVDEDGTTWYIWYYRNMRLKESSEYTIDAN